MALCLQILEIFRVIGAKPHHHGKVADLGGVEAVEALLKLMVKILVCSADSV